MKIALICAVIMLCTASLAVAEEIQIRELVQRDSHGVVRPILVQNEQGQVGIILSVQPIAPVNFRPIISTLKKLRTNFQRTPSICFRICFVLAQLASRMTTSAPTQYDSLRSSRSRGRCHLLGWR